MPPEQPGPAGAPVQPIVVQPGTHEDTVTAAALASVRRLIVSEMSEGCWDEWLSGSFTKSVRRTRRPREFDRVLALPGAGPVVDHGTARAVAFAPLAEFPREVKRLQVSGLDCARAGNWPTGAQPA